MVVRVGMAHLDQTSARPRQGEGIAPPPLRRSNPPQRRGVWQLGSVSARPMRLLGQSSELATAPTGIATERARPQRSLAALAA